MPVIVDPRTPSRVYKFFDKPEYARDLVERGSVQVGTLARFRAAESVSGGRLDPDEGRQTVSLTSESPEIIDSANVPWYLERVLAALGQPIASYGGTISVGIQFPDAYVYCTSRVDSPEVRRAFGDFGVAISDARGFYGTLTEHLIRELSIVPPLGFIGCCRYEGKLTAVTRAATPVDPLHVAFTKASDYETQQEVRGVWPSSSALDSPHRTICAGLRRFCALVGGAV